MDIKQELTRKTEVRLSNEEFLDAIRMYLKDKGVKDTDQHVVVDIIETNGDAGTVLNVIIKNYDLDKNLSKHLD